MDKPEVRAALERLAQDAEQFADRINAVEVSVHVDRDDGTEYVRYLGDVAKDLREALAALPPAASEVGEDDEYMSVTLSRNGVVTSHNAFDANFDEMVEATRKIIDVLQSRLDNRIKCPFASGSALREAALAPKPSLQVPAGEVEPDWAVSKDGPHAITDVRRWLARKLMDSKLSDWEALGIVGFHPDVRDRTALAPKPSLQVPAGEVGQLTEEIVRNAHRHYLHDAEFPCGASAMREAIELALAALQPSTSDPNQPKDPAA